MILAKYLRHRAWPGGCVNFLDFCVVENRYFRTFGQSSAEVGSLVYEFYKVTRGRGSTRFRSKICSIWTRGAYCVFFQDYPKDVGGCLSKDVNYIWCRAFWTATGPNQSFCDATMRHGTDTPDGLSSKMAPSVSCLFVNFQAYLILIHDKSSQICFLFQAKRLIVSS